MSRTIETAGQASRSVLDTTLTDFYREEFLKHRQCIERNRAYYSEAAVSQAEAAISRILSELDRLCCKADADRIVCSLLKQFDSVTGLSAWSDPKTFH